MHKNRWEAWLPVISGQDGSVKAAGQRLMLYLLSGVYRLGLAIKNRRWNNPAQIKKVGVPVISVGNLTTGGTGKTPMVQWLCRYLRDRDLRVALLSRGYGSVNAGPNDEALELELSLPDVPHLQDADRVRIAEVAIEELETQCLVLDDGFQHRRLHRDLDMVLIDATCPFGFGHLLPRGLLREPKMALSRADVLVITRCDQVSDPELKRIEEELQKYCQLPRTLIAKTVHQPVALVDSRGVRRPLTDLSHHQLLLFAGIGNPNAFFQKVQHMGAQVAGTRSFPDHYHYQREDIQSLRAWVDEHRVNAPEPNLRPWLVVTTRKDLVKLDIWQLSGVDVVAMEVELQFLSGKVEFEELVESAAALADRPTSTFNGRSTGRSTGGSTGHE